MVGYENEFEMLKLQHSCPVSFKGESLFHAEILWSVTNNGIFDIESHTFAEDDIEFGDDDGIVIMEVVMLTKMMKRLK